MTYKLSFFASYSEFLGYIYLLLNTAKMFTTAVKTLLVYINSLIVQWMVKLSWFTDRQEKAQKSTNVRFDSYFNIHFYADDFHFFLMFIYCICLPCQIIMMHCFLTEEKTG